jgi:K+ transporter
MKNLIFITGALLIALNTFTGLIVSSYAPFNFLLADLGIALSTGIMYFTASGSLPTGYKVGLTGLFSFLSIVQVVLIVIAPQEWENNMLLVAAFGIFVFEVLCITAATAVKDK